MPETPIQAENYTGPWCHTCDLPITDAETIRHPIEGPEVDWDGSVLNTSVYLLGCARCLIFPTDDEADHA